MKIEYRHKLHTSEPWGPWQPLGASNIFHLSITQLFFDASDHTDKHITKLRFEWGSYGLYDYREVK